MLHNYHKKDGFDYNRLLALYKKYLATQTNEYIVRSIESDLERIEKNLDMLKNLDIDYTIEEIESSFDKYGVIMLRPIGGMESLLLGCGNCPVDSNFSDKVHAHTGYDTINPELTMNPTVVGAFGVDKGLLELLPKDHYKRLSGERLTIALYPEDFDHQYLECCKSDFVTDEISEVIPVVYPSFVSSPFIFYETKLKYFFEELSFLDSFSSKPDKIIQESNGDISFCYNDSKKREHYFDHHDTGKKTEENSLYKLTFTENDLYVLYLNGYLIPRNERNDTLLRKLFEENSPLNRVFTSSKI